MTGGPTDEELAEKLAFLDVHVEGYRRPVLVENVLAAGLETLRPGAKNARSLLLRLVSELKRLTAKADRSDVLERRVVEMERKLVEIEASFTEAELSKIRTYHRYGVKVDELAQIFKVDANRIRRVLKMRERPLSTEIPSVAPRIRKRNLEV